MYKGKGNVSNANINITKRHLGIVYMFVCWTAMVFESLAAEGL